MSYPILLKDQRDLIKLLKAAQTLGIVRLTPKGKRSISHGSLEQEQETT